MVSIMCIPFLKTAIVLFLRTDPKELTEEVYKVYISLQLCPLWYTSQGKIIKANYSTRRNLSRNYGQPNK